MAGNMSRNKGARGEREVIKLLQPIVDKAYAKAGIDKPKLQRNTLQSDGGGFDIVGLKWLALEVKFHETLNINSWWKQTLRQAGPNQLPVLFYRKSHAKWRVRTLGTLMWSGRFDNPIEVDISLDDFLVYLELILKEELLEEK